MSSGLIKKKQPDSSTFVRNQPLSNPVESQTSEKDFDANFSDLQQLQLWAGALVVLPVFVQAPWVRLNPLSACL
ncbi:MAG: DUF3120 domain-containing protein, partial [Prochlorococcus sp. ALOHA_A2.0_51]|nr:DUF3120 domain-containing protein [Prochlorococcus sp. ALOHA_A2.0_51]